MQNLNIALVQPEITWEAPEANLGHLEGLLAAVHADVVVLPEMFTTGFSMAPERLAHHGPAAQVWLRSQAQTLNALLLGSVITEESGKYFNRLFASFPDGRQLSYDKRHLFRMAQEHHHYAAGSERLVVEHKGWRICPLVCYDLRFPVFSRNSRTGEHLAYDLLVYLANWPATRASAWDILAKARAVENLCYTVAVNRVGTDGNGVPYAGGSQAVDPKGNPLIHLGAAERVATVELDGEALLRYREKFPAWQDADRFTLHTAPSPQ